MRALSPPVVSLVHIQVIVHIIAQVVKPSAVVLALVLALVLISLSPYPRSPAASKRGYFNFFIPSNSSHVFTLRIRAYRAGYDLMI